MEKYESFSFGDGPQGTVGSAELKVNPHYRDADYAPPRAVLLSVTASCKPKATATLRQDWTPLFGNRVRWQKTSSKGLRLELSYYIPSPQARVQVVASIRKTDGTYVCNDETYQTRVHADTIATKGGFDNLMAAYWTRAKQKLASLSEPTRSAPNQQAVLDGQNAIMRRVR